MVWNLYEYVLGSVCCVLGCLEGGFSGFDILDFGLFRVNGEYEVGWGF